MEGYSSGRRRSFSAPSAGGPEVKSQLPASLRIAVIRAKVRDKFKVLAVPPAQATSRVLGVSGRRPGFRGCFPGYHVRPRVLAYAFLTSALTSKENKNTLFVKCPIHCLLDWRNP